MRKKNNYKSMTGSPGIALKLARNALSSNIFTKKSTTLLIQANFLLGF